MTTKRRRKPFARIVAETFPTVTGRFHVESTGARWGTYDSEAEAQEKTDRLNDVTSLDL